MVYLALLVLQARLVALQAQPGPLAHKVLAYQLKALFLLLVICQAQAILPATHTLFNPMVVCTHGQALCG